MYHRQYKSITCSRAMKDVIRIPHSSWYRSRLRNDTRPLQPAPDKTLDAARIKHALGIWQERAPEMIFPSIYRQDDPGDPGGRGREEKHRRIGDID